MARVGAPRGLTAEAAGRKSPSRLMANAMRVAQRSEELKAGGRERRQRRVASAAPRGPKRTAEAAAGGRGEEERTEFGRTRRRAALKRR
jgi:hypothetical protein